jgi:hypothetical protein
MIRTIEQGALPERFQSKGLGLVVARADQVPAHFIGQVIAKSRQPHVLEYEGHEDVGTARNPGRFRDLESYYAWAKGKERILYMMINRALNPDGQAIPDIGGVIWFGERSHPRAPGRDLTFAIRNYDSDDSHGWGAYVGQGLGTPFMQATHADVRRYYPDKNIWLDLVDGNAAAEHLYRKNGYEVIDRFEDPEHDGQARVLMANDTVLHNQAAA